MRLILIDNNSGYIFGDTAGFGACVDFGFGSDWRRNAEIAAQTMDEMVAGEFGRKYEAFSVNPRETSDGYHVYRADAHGSEAVAIIHDGQDQEAIEAVERNCGYYAYVRCISASDEEVAL